MTNLHVIRGASDTKVALIDSIVHPAKVWNAPQSNSSEQNHCPGCTMKHDFEHPKVSFTMVGGHYNLLLIAVCLHGLLPC